MKTMFSGYCCLHQVLELLLPLLLLLSRSVMIADNKYITPSLYYAQRIFLSFFALLFGLHRISFHFDFEYIATSVKRRIKKLYEDRAATTTIAKRHSKRHIVRATRMW